MYRLVCAKNMRAADESAMNDYGISSLILMENAGHELFQLVREKLSPVDSRRLLILCGNGNNGGDGLCCARIARNNGCAVTVLMTGHESSLSPDCQTNFQIYSRCFPESILFLANLDKTEIQTLLSTQECIIDAVYGTGFHGNLPENIEALIHQVNSCHAMKIACDVPSGVDATSGKVSKTAFRAHFTVSFGAPKTGLFLRPGLNYSGNIYLGIIGIPDQVFEAMDISCYLAGKKDIVQMLPQREKTCHKGDFGKVLIIAGSRGMYGAPLLCAKAALESGAGLVYLAVPENIEQVIASRVTEIITVPLSLSPDGGISENNQISLETYDIAVIGPGLGRKASTVRFIQDFCRNFPGTLIIDADGVNAMTPELLKEISSRKEVIFTPHTGEIARFFSISPETVLEDQLDFYQEKASEFNCLLLGKGANSFVVRPDKKIYFTKTGNPGMAVGGMGDLLCGIIAGITAEGMKIRKTWQSVLAAVYFHGFLGDLCLKQSTERSLTPEKMLSLIPEAFRELSGEEK